MNEKELLRTEALRVGYGKRAVVDEIVLQARPGEVLCLIAPNGAGKSTILKTLIRRLPPLGGTAFLEGDPLFTMDGHVLAKKSAAVLTGRADAEFMRCEEVVALGRYPYTGMLGVLSPEDREKIDATIALVGIGDIRHAPFDRISDGQRQRVMLARALCQEPKLLLLDEPTSYLDLRNKLEFLHLLRTLAREKKIAVIMSLHELDLAQKFSDTLVCLKSSRVDRIGTPEEIFTGNYIESLYEVDHGSYDTLFGTSEPAAPEGKPEIFVIGGGGAGIPVYRALQRKSIPFAAGVLQENDLDLPVARALAAAVVTEKAFEPVSEEKLTEALAILHSCRGVICAVDTFGTMNRLNETLLRTASRSSLLLQLSDL